MKLSSPKTAVVILNWNGRAFLEKFLPSVIEHSAAATVVIADNGSTDDSVAFVQTHYPSLKIVCNDKNLGFAQGYNDALQNVEAEYYVLLNSDVEVSAGWIEPIIQMMDQDPSVACVQPKLLAYDAPDQFEYAGGAGGFIDYLGFPFCRGRIFDSLEKDTLQYEDACEIFWASGAAMFVRADLYHLHGGLDGDFFAHMEEIDFCWRMKNLGYKIMYCPQSVVYHVGGGMLPKSSPFKTFLNFRNNLALLYKNLPSKSLTSVLWKRLFLDIVASFSFLLRASFAEFAAVYKAHYQFWKSYTLNRKKRQALKQVSSHKEMYNQSIVWAHYVKRKKLFSQLSFGKRS